MMKVSRPTLLGGRHDPLVPLRAAAEQPQFVLFALSLFTLALRGSLGSSLDLRAGELNALALPLITCALQRFRKSHRRFQRHPSRQTADA